MMIGEYQYIARHVCCGPFRYRPRSYDLKRRLERNPETWEVLGVGVSILIIGAGVAGLSTGCYAQMNGFTTEIFEMGDKPGGLCTAWTRGGYTFDYCIHNLAGTAPSSRYYRMWRELGALQPESNTRAGAESTAEEAELARPYSPEARTRPAGPDWTDAGGCPVYHYKELVRVEDPSGKSLTIGPDIDRLERDLVALAKDDTGVIREYVQGVRAFKGLDLLSLTGAGIGGALRLLPHAGKVLRWMKPTLAEFAQRFSDPFLRRAFRYVQYDMPATPTGVHLSMIAGMSRGDCGWPVGGSLAFSRAIERRYRDLGGRVHYRSKVARILTENGRAVGVRLADGSEHRGDVVVSAADGHGTIFDMLEGRYVNQAVRSYYAAAPETQDMALHVCFGVNRDLSREPHALVLLLDKPVEIAGHVRDRLGVEILNFDPVMAPPGKSVIKVPLEARYAFWQSLKSGGGDAYRAAKEEVAAQVLDLLETRFSGLGRQVEVTDVSTPLTVERYTGNWRGLQAWMPPGNPMGAFLKGAFMSTLPGLGGFFMVGQWACGVIGLTTAASAGRRLVQSLCRRFGRPFAAFESESEEYRR
ncbi:MAG: NAD(P)/FAD-dependent oxidoreductase [Firmicutes bacterium]|jgi:phytoene dehydrogenase-like protein|nr:NAD(P)/FAD-dependent oxidoreductase [Bacillota bacterium]MDH7495488.1 NAD(P)/FAD-dependent oxidoreductase [Bacillota bacterium]